ncbi:MAG: hypothetical protein HOU81_00065 [Hamadaea sp.]|uniref:hypothetical protein n=1 Tax=Hamadaea sp. TaxID=2024425 RepID=UPI00179C82C8|nr:hypothetical protein [Hamadaea sp.]NUR69211.1 hypothetical protein [Hamadaea sp.]NUT20049.1 hypothetical protein [Hamadaea sp.]
MTRLVRIGALVLVLLAPAACAGRDHPTSVVDSVGGSGEDDWGLNAEGLDRWQKFPVTAKPRPLVLIGGRIHEAGYTTVEAKMAVSAGLVEVPGTPPAGPPKVRTELPVGRAELRTIGSAEALNLIVKQGTPSSERVAPVKITSVAFGSGEFLTDRGPLKLPAWLFSSPEMLGPIAVLALDPAALWVTEPAVYPLASSGNTIAADDRTLVVQLPEAAEGTCPGQPVYAYEAVSEESATAVQIGLTRRQTGVTEGDPKQNCTQPTMLRLTAYTVTLVEPLGNRVVIQRNGAPIPITRKA